MNSLYKIFIGIIKDSREVEILKQKLNDKIEFEPYGVFTRLDRKEAGYIDINSLKKFLKENNKEYSRLELLIEYYDRDFDGLLSLEEYLSFILPQHSFIRTVSTQKKTYKIPRDEFLTEELEGLLTDIIITESNMFNRANSLKTELFANESPDLLSIFLGLDSDRDGEISLTDLDLFFRKKGMILYEEQITALISIYDEDLNKSWNWNEFLFMILPSRMTYEYDTEYLKQLENQYLKIYENILKENQYVNNSIIVKASHSQKWPLVNYNESCDITQDTIYNSRDNFISDLYKLIQYEKNLENIKIKLAYDANFTLIGLFSHFDKRTSEYISISDLVFGLEHFNIINDNRIRLIFDYHKVSKLK